MSVDTYILATSKGDCPKVENKYWQQPVASTKNTQGGKEEYHKYGFLGTTTFLKNLSNFFSLYNFSSP